MRFFTLQKRGRLGGIYLSGSVHGKQSTVDSLDGINGAFSVWCWRNLGRMLITNRIWRTRRLLHQGSSGCLWWKRGAQNQCIGSSRGGLTTKIHALVDGLGNPLHIHLTSGSVHGVREAQTLIEKAKGKYFIADKGYDSDKVIEAIQHKGMIPVIPSKLNRKVRRKIDKHIYKERHLIENFFGKIKRYRRIATRYEKLAANYLGFILFASIRMWLA